VNSPWLGILSSSVVKERHDSCVGRLLVWVGVHPEYLMLYLLIDGQLWKLWALD